MIIEKMSVALENLRVKSVASPLQKLKKDITSKSYIDIKIAALGAMLLGASVGLSLVYAGSSFLLYAAAWGTSVVAVKNYLALPGALIFTLGVFGGAITIAVISDKELRQW